MLISPFKNTAFFFSVLCLPYIVSIAVILPYKINYLQIKFKTRFLSVDADRNRVLLETYFTAPS